MKRRQCFAGILLLALLASGASVWEGSAIVGGAGDFPGDGLFGACNSFPRDASVEVRNLENGKTITVVITKNVENPGVFIALSPKAATELGMRQGSAARVRAVALSLSMTEATLPAARAGETADPDFNPKIYVERDKVIAQSRAAQEPTATAETPVAAAIPAPAPAATAVQPASPAPPTAAESTATPTTETAAAIIAEAAAEPVAGAEPTEAVAAAETSPAEAEAGPEQVPIEKVPADLYPLPTLASASPGEPRPESIGVELPLPDAAPIPATSGAPSPRTFPTNVPEVFGGYLPRPRSAAAARAFLPDPAVAELAAETKAEGEVANEAPSLVGGDRPSIPQAALAAALEEPKIEFEPDELPEDLLPRLAGPAPNVPDVALAEIDMSAIAKAPEETTAQPEALGLDRPAGTETAALAEGLDEPEPRELEVAEAEGGPEAIASAQPEAALIADAGLADPNVPTPSESLTIEKPTGMEGKVAEAALEEPAPAEALAGEGPTAVAVEVPAQATSPEAELSVPATPSPTESLAVERPEEGPVAVEEGGETVVGLEPTAPLPPSAAPMAMAPSEAAPVPAAPQGAVVAPAAVVPGRPAEVPPSIPLLSSLARGSFYVQIGVYGNNDTLLGAVGGFAPTYPLAVEKVSAKGGIDAFRLYIGPLTRDESGLVLFQIRSMGYRDAFVKQGS